MLKLLCLSEVKLHKLQKNINYLKNKNQYLIENRKNDLRKWGLSTIQMNIRIQQCRDKKYNQCKVIKELNGILDAENKKLNKVETIFKRAQLKNNEVSENIKECTNKLEECSHRIRYQCFE